MQDFTIYGSNIIEFPGSSNTIVLTKSTALDLYVPKLLQIQYFQLKDINFKVQFNTKTYCVDLFLMGEHVSMVPYKIQFSVRPPPPPPPEL